MTNLLLLSTGGLIGIIVGALVLLLVIILIAWWIGTRNGFVRLKNKVEEAWATIDVYLKKRYDLIPNLVETVKGYANHESETLKEVISARSAAMQAKTPAEKTVAEQGLDSSLRTLFTAVAENYPDLKANSNFLDLQNQLKTLESEIERSRRYYNGVVKAFNTKLEVFPANIVGRGMGEEYQKRPYFELTNAQERENVQVRF